MRHAVTILRPVKDAVICGLAVLAVAALSAPAARAEACPGSGPRPCPYVSDQLIGDRAEGVLRFPEAVAVDPQGDVFVADQLSYAIQKFNAAGTLEAEWGSFGGGRGQFGPVGAIAADAAGDLYVVDSSHNRIEEFDPAGNEIRAWGHPGRELGQFNFGSSQDYTHPPGGGIAVAGNFVYVADSGNNRIERFNLEGGEPFEWGGYGGGPGQFAYPRGIAANAGEVLVTDDFHRVQRFSPEGVFLGSAGSAGSGPGQFGFTYGVALDAAGDVYVADDLGHRVVKLNPQLAFAGAWGGYGSLPGELAFPRALASDPAGDTYVADTANDRVEVYDPNGNYLRTIGISAKGPGQMTAPRGLALDPTGRLLVSDTDGNRVELFSPGSYRYAGQWTAMGGAHANLNRPAGVAVDPLGSVYVGDVGNGRLVRLWGDGTFLGEIGGPLGSGGTTLSGFAAIAVAPAGGTTYLADAAHNRILVYGPEGSLRARWGAEGGSGVAGRGPGQFNRPAGVAVAPNGEVYVADTANNRVVRLTAEGSVIGEWGSYGYGAGRFRSPNGVAVDAAGKVFVLDGGNNRVQTFDPSGRLLGTWGSRGTGLGQFSQPAAIAVDCSGDVYVADTNNNRVQRFSMAAPDGPGCLAPGSWPPPLDVAPVLHVSLPRAGGVLSRRALALAVSCERGCRILATATLAPRGHRSQVPLAVVARLLPRGQAGHVRIRVGSLGLRRLRRMLGHRRVMVARVRIIAVGPTGRRTTLQHAYLVSR